MSFTSLEFAATLGLAFLARLTVGRAGRGPLYAASLLGLSLVFYAWSVPWYLGLVVFTAGLHYCAGVYLSRPRWAWLSREWVLAIAVGISLALLAVFKYANFVIDIANTLLGSLRIHFEWDRLALALPIGISFYTFHALSYTIDLRRGRTQPANRFWDFVLYISFFPQLVAGPITRATEFLYQLHRKRSLSFASLLEAIYLIIRGFFFKLVVADNIARIVDEYWPIASKIQTNSLLSLLVVFLFSMQIFADFSGYTDIARGTAYLLGYRLPLNFAAPYLAGAFSQFWRRWHISLSRWLRDYLYIPLGGNRTSGIRTYANLMAVMLLGGLWHGAAITFLVWGGIHGAGLALERLLRLDQRHALGARLAWGVVVQSVVLLAWAFFRATSVGEAWAILQNVFTVHFEAPLQADLGWGLAASTPVIGVQILWQLRRQNLVPAPGPLALGAWAAVMCYLTLTCYGRTFTPFIYFRF